MPRQDKMTIGMMVAPAGCHPAAWRHPEASPVGGLDFDHYRVMAQEAERGKMHFLFWADFLCMPDGPADIVSRSAFSTIQYEPITLMSALSTVTSKIGLIMTASTTYQPAYTVARQFASLDRLSGGRVAWNVVTSFQAREALNYGLKEQVDHDERYVRAGEYVDVVCKLWDSVAPDALVCDKEGGRFFDPAKVHALDHEGTYFSVKGPLNIAHSTAGRPVIVQAGSSGPGRDLAAAVAEVVFTPQPQLEAAVAFRQDMHERMKKVGRDPGSIRILPGFVPVIGKDKADAMARLAELDALVDPVLAINQLKIVVGGAIDLDGISPDALMPHLPLDGAQGLKSIMAKINAMREENPRLTVGDAAKHVSSGMGHLMAIGSASEIVDVMEEWFLAGACDGFNVTPLLTPGGVTEFVDLIVPELQRRGLFQLDYAGTSLRENLGIEAI
jgi:N-acetyl-S-(2-succino)cysteine monooxygenase